MTMFFHIAAEANRSRQWLPVDVDIGIGKELYNPTRRRPEENNGGCTGDAAGHRCRLAPLQE